MASATQNKSHTVSWTNCPRYKSKSIKEHPKCSCPPVTPTTLPITESSQEDHCDDRNDRQPQCRQKVDSHSSLSTTARARTRGGGRRRSRSDSRLRLGGGCSCCGRSLAQLFRCEPNAERNRPVCSLLCTESSKKFENHQNAIPTNKVRRNVGGNSGLLRTCRHFAGTARRPFQ